MTSNPMIGHRHRSEYVAAVDELDDEEENGESGDEERRPVSRRLNGSLLYELQDVSKKEARGTQCIPDREFRLRVVLLMF